MRLLKVQGKGHVSVEPDLVTLSFDVSIQAKDYAQCLDALNARTEDLRKSMADSGLNRAQLKTSAFNVEVDNEYEKGRYTFVGYQASHRLSIELPVDCLLLNHVLRHISQGHSGAEIKLCFSVKDKNALHQRVLAQAVQTAKDNAQALAAAAGVALGNLQQIDYGWVEVRVYEQSAIMACAGPQAISSEPDIEPEDVKAEDTVTLVYEVTG